MAKPGQAFKLLSGKRNDRLVSGIEKGEGVRMTRDPLKINITEAYEAVFLGVLGRKPSSDEVAAWMSNNGAATSVGSLAEALRTTDEYRDRLALESERMARAADGRKVFFLHIPKSGGISIRAQFRASLGHVAPILLADSPLPYQIEPGATSWPFLTGHIGIDTCPPGYSCVTVFREPRARLLSLHRFVASRHYEAWLSSVGLNPEVSRQWRESSIDSLIENNHEMPLGIDGHVLHARQGLHYAWMFAEGFSTPAGFAAVSRAEGELAIKRGLQRISHAAWTHDGPGIARMIERASGRRPGEIARLNITKPTISGSPGVINRKTRELLADFLRDDMQVLEMAASAGLVEALSADVRDTIFKETALRLGYIYE